MQNYTDMFRLDGRVAVVTGAGFGLGRAFALGLAAFGATVVCADRDMPNAEETVGLARQSHGKAAAAHVDVAEEASVDAFWDKLKADHGGLDILINNAGVFNMGGEGGITLGPLQAAEGRAPSSVAVGSTLWKEGRGT